MQYHKTVDAIKQLLDTKHIHYTCYEHAAVRTSEEAAAIRPEYTIDQGAKALIVRIKRKGVATAAAKQYVQLVLPGSATFTPKVVRASLGAKDIRFATETEVAELTGGVEPGGVPPFGNLFNLPVYVDPTLLHNDIIIFNAGDRCYSIALRSDDYVAAVQPTVVTLI